MNIYIYSTHIYIYIYRYVLHVYMLPIDRPVYSASTPPLLAVKLYCTVSISEVVKLTHPLMTSKVFAEANC